MLRFGPLALLIAVALGIGACEDKSGGTAASADTTSAADSKVAADSGSSDVSATDSQAQGNETKSDSAVTDSAQPDVAPVDVVAEVAAVDTAQDVAVADAAVEVAPGNPCVVAGGTVETQNCCKATGDFPNLCAVGACGCSPDNSKATLVCKCPDGKCFDGKDCSKQ